jgi:hypothetical protein
MKRYVVYGVFTATKIIGEFEANSTEEAEDMAADSENNFAILCHQCANDIEMDDNCASKFIVEPIQD